MRSLPLATWNFLRQRIRFHLEGPREVVADLPRLLDYPVGDCDDLAVAVATLGLAGKMPARFAMGIDTSGSPVHVWTELWDGAAWIGVDPHPLMGEPPSRTFERSKQLTDVRYYEVEGL